MESLVEEITGEKYNFKGVKKMSEEELEKKAKDYCDMLENAREENEELQEKYLSESYEKAKLVKENEELKAYVEKLSDNHIKEWEIQHQVIEVQQQVISELKGQIEKMKCCDNCKHHNVACLLEEPCENEWNKWELAEC